MSTPPKASREEVAAAIARIARRRLKLDDRSRDRLPDAPDSEPREVLRYLVAHSGNNVPREVRHADAKDALVLCNFLWWEHRRLEWHFLKAGAANGVFLSELGGLVGVSSRQGTRDRIDRSTALLEHDEGPDEKYMRQHRRDQRQAAAGGERSPETIWLDANWPEIAAVITALDAEADRLNLEGDEERGWLDELVRDVKEHDVTRQTMTRLGLATGDLRVAKTIVSLPTRRPHKVHELLHRADALRSAFAGLGTQKS